MHSEKLPQTSVARYVLVTVNLFPQVWLVTTSLTKVIVTGPPQLSVALTKAGLGAGPRLAQLTVIGAGQAVMDGGV